VGDTLEFFEQISVALGYLIAVVSLSTGVIFVFVRLASAVGLRKQEGREEGAVREFLQNFH
jgi:hypothetical protein